MYEILLNKIEKSAIIFDKELKIRFANGRFKEFLKLEYVVNLNLNQLLYRKIDEIKLNKVIDLEFFDNSLTTAIIEPLDEFYLLIFQSDKSICNLLTIFTYGAKPDFKIITSTENIREILGYDKEQFESLKYGDFIYPKDFDKFKMESDLNIIKSGAFFQREPYRIIDSYGDIKWLYESVVYENGIFRAILIDITKYKEYEKNAKNSTKVLESILNSSTNAIMTYEAIRNDSSNIIDFNCHLVNRSAEKILELESQILLDKTLLENFPKIKNTIFKEYCKVVEKDITFRVESKYKTENSNYKWLDISVVKFRDGITISISDITNRKRYESSIKELNKELELRVQNEISKREDIDIQYKSVFDNSFLGIFMVDLDGKILTTNKSFNSMLSYPKDELIGKKFIDITYIDDKERDFNLFKALIDGSVRFYQVNKRYVKKSGDILLTKLIVNSVKDSKGNIKYILAMVEDITEKLAIEKRHKEQEAILIQQSKMAQMGEMIGSIAHQWKQPLNAINILVGDFEDLFHHNELTLDEIERIISTIKKEVNFMSATIEDFRNFFKPSKVYTAFLLKEIILEIQRLLKPQFNKNSIQIDVDCDDKIQISGYPNEFKQVLINIITNAKDAIDSNGIQNGLIQISARDSYDKTIITISDNGGGIRDDLIEEIFNPYISTKGDKGTGIGLHMSRIIIENMKGKIYARNSDIGAIFIIEMERYK